MTAVVVVEPEEAAWLNSWCMPQLKKMCRAHGLPVGGLKSDLMGRLVRALRRGQLEGQGQGPGQHGERERRLSLRHELHGIARPSERSVV